MFQNHCICSICIHTISDENNLQDSFCPVTKEQGVCHNLRQAGYGLQDQSDVVENLTGDGPMAENMKQFYKFPDESIMVYRTVSSNEIYMFGKNNSSSTVMGGVVNAPVRSCLFHWD